MPAIMRWCQKRSGAALWQRSAEKKGRVMANVYYVDGQFVADSEAVFPINDLGMYRGRVSAGIDPQTAIFADEKWPD